MRKCDAIKGRVGFRAALGAWFAAQGRDYPWRRTQDPYSILVSEVMLQQTQIATVLGRGYYAGFLARFPDVAALAAADDGSLLKAWEGLGYYRRARLLRDTARAVVAEHGGVFPQETGKLLELPGIGRYTAGAVRAFAFGLPGAVVDGNVARVLARVMDFTAPVDDSKGLAQVWAWAELLEDRQRPARHNAALMELGQTLCRPGVPDCAKCPVAIYCRTQTPEVLPVKRKAAAVTAVIEHALWLRDGKGRVLLHHQTGARRTGLWQLPVRLAAEISRLPVVAVRKYAITRYRVSLRVHAGDDRCGPQAGDAWLTATAARRLPMASPFRKVLDELLEIAENRM